MCGRQVFSDGTDYAMGWLLMAGMTADERERYVDAVLLEGGFPMQPEPPRPEELESVR
jgi:hypothetical protein